MDLRVSVIIPYYNRARTLARCLESIALQSKKPDEVVIVDDGSSECIPATIIEQFEEQLSCKLVRHPQNCGVSASRNTGLVNATHEIIAFLDSDDTWSRDHLSTCCDLLSKFDDIDIIFGRDEIVDSDDYIENDQIQNIHNRSTIWKNEGTQLSEGVYRINSVVINDLLLRFKGRVHLSSVVMRSVRPGMMVFFDEMLTLQEDTDYLLRVSAQSDAIYLDNCQSYYYIHDSNTITIYKSSLQNKLPNLLNQTRFCQKKMLYTQTDFQDEYVRDELADYYYNIGLVYTLAGEMTKSFDWFKKSFRTKPTVHAFKHLIVQKMLPTNVSTKIYDLFQK